MSHQILVVERDRRILQEIEELFASEPDISMIAAPDAEAADPPAEEDASAEDDSQDSADE